MPRRDPQVRRPDGEACAALRGRLDALDAEAVDVLVLVPDGGDAERVSTLVDSAARMWRERPVGAVDLRVVTETLDTDAASTHPLLDPEIVFVAADPSSADVAKTVAVYDADGTHCVTVADALSLPSWAALDGFSSHHSLPEGIYLHPCGSSGDRVCVAVNPTLDDPDLAGGPFEAYGLVGDELSHCLS